MDKKEVAEIFEEIALLLEMKGENPFRIRAYRNGARSLLNSEEDLRNLIKEKRLTELEGIGEDLAEKITTLAKTGRLPFYEKLKKSIPRGILELRQVRGLGAKKIQLLYEKLGIHSVAALKKACEAGKIAKIRGFGKRTEDNILDALGHTTKYQTRHLWWEAMELAAPLLEKLRKIKGVRRAEVAGSIRRKLETVGDLDLLVASSNPKPIMSWLTNLPSVEKVQAKGDTRSSVRLKGDLQADLRVLPEEEFAYALCYFTGSKAHNIKLRERARRLGWSLSEYGFTPIGKKRAAPLIRKKVPTEEDIYQALGLDFIPPELREDMGEIETAAKHKLPKLVEEKEIRGTLHNHTTASDGRNNLKEMVEAAQEIGWEYIGISDHSKSSFQANGLKEEKLEEQIGQIRKINQSKSFKPWIFSGTECDILPNGSLDFSNALLEQLDFVIVSVHSTFSQDEKTMTRRILKAIEHPLTTILAHPTGRLLLRRDPYKVNLAKVIDACIANEKIIEINGNPLRLDMDWRLWHRAAEKGLKCCINTDAHDIEGLQFVQTGVHVARKGWLEAKDVINTLPLKELQRLLRQKPSNK